jgi:hypothetical protein
MVRRVEVQPVDSVQRGLNLWDVKHIADYDFGAGGPQPSTAFVVAMYQSPSHDALL